MVPSCEVPSMLLFLDVLGNCDRKNMRVRHGWFKVTVEALKEIPMIHHDSLVEFYMCS